MIMMIVTKMIKPIMTFAFMEGWNDDDSYGDGENDDYDIVMIMVLMATMDYCTRVPRHRSLCPRYVMNFFQLHMDTSYVINFFQLQKISYSITILFQN